MFVFTGGFSSGQNFGGFRSNDENQESVGSAYAPSPAQCPQNILISCHPSASQVPCVAPPSY